MTLEALQAELESNDEDDIAPQSSASSSEDQTGAGQAPRQRHRRSSSSNKRALEEQKAAWLLADAAAAPIRGAPLRCLLCSSVLLLNSSASFPGRDFMCCSTQRASQTIQACVPRNNTQHAGDYACQNKAERVSGAEACAGTFKAHLASKRHLKAAARSNCADDQAEQLARVTWADAGQHRDTDGETHGERLVRLHEVRLLLLHGSSMYLSDLRMQVNASAVPQACSLYVL